MSNDKRRRGLGAGLLALTMMGSLAAGSLTARADDPPPKDKGKQGKKQDNIPIKIVPPIIVPDKGKGGGKHDK